MKFYEKYSMFYSTYIYIFQFKFIYVHTKLYILYICTLNKKFSEKISICNLNLDHVSRSGL